MRERQHVWVGPEATCFAEPCETCLATADSRAAEFAVVRGTLRTDADVGFVTCPRGHRIVVHRVARPRPRSALAQALGS